MIEQNDILEIIDISKFFDSNMLLVIYRRMNQKIDEMLKYKTVPDLPQLSFVYDLFEIMAMDLIRRVVLGMSIMNLELAPTEFDDEKLKDLDSALLSILKCNHTPTSREIFLKNIASIEKHFVSRKFISIIKQVQKRYRKQYTRVILKLIKLRKRVTRDSEEEFENMMKMNSKNTSPTERNV
ncbi:hypothetical protein M153_5160003318 [Pseudoloma neurophilia]|uniref:Uncharacterized protein n=1 Tax=Pseudoloma neurophilia TaxID=146866 RepID=A0A0R0M140_9MICR|nr:hypothetical protein M153_5160003318 [Pseudoloma neurophilia]